MLHDDVVFGKCVRVCLCLLDDDVVMVHPHVLFQVDVSKKVYCIRS